jgi:hypothetical protein
MVRPGGWGGPWRPGQTMLQCYIGAENIDRAGPLYYPGTWGSLKRDISGTPRARINVTLSIFNFSTLFFAQIVENRETQLSSPFLGHGDNFSKSYDENQIWCAPARAPRARHAGRKFTKIY